jgi:phage baseplate assembly protein W
MATLTKIYSDIDFTFTKKPVTGDIALGYDTQAVIRSIRNLLLTKRYERPFNPELGSNIDALLFEMVSPVTASSLESEIRNVIDNYEPRAQVSDLIVKSDPDGNAYNITITF